MNVAVYIARPGSAIGGGINSGVILAQALSRLHRVEIVLPAHQKAYWDRDRLATFSGASLSAVSLRYAAREPHPFGRSWNPWRRYQEARAWDSALSEPYDIFINFTDEIPPFCGAPIGVLYVLFAADPFANASVIGRGLRRLLYRWECKRRFNRYQLKLADSRYTQEWAKRRWGIDCQILYPPGDIEFRVGDDKENMILSVGRFHITGHAKKQLQMVTAFSQMEAQLQGWEYVCVGGLGHRSEDHAYFESVRRAGARCRARVLANLKREDLKRFYEKAKIFWHAAGYGDDVSRFPGLAEHFGMVTVEAMGAGCVPVVINLGGQPEIVQHGVNGFLWDSLDELKGYTMLLARDDRLRAQMAEAARARARFFSRETYVERFLKLLQPSLS